MEMQENEEKPWFDSRSWIDVVAMAFSVWFIWYFLATPVRSFFTDLIRPAQVDLQKDQQRLP